MSENVAMPAKRAQAVPPAPPTPKPAVKEEVKRKEHEAKKAKTLPRNLEEPVEKNVVKQSADEAKPSPA